MSYSASFEGGLNTITRVIALGTGAVSSASHVVGAFPKRGKIVRIRYKGLVAVVGTTFTADTVIAPPDGSTPSLMLQTAPTDIEFDSVAEARIGVEATLNPTLQANRGGLDGQMLIVVLTAAGVTSGPGDLLVEVAFEPR